jgi:RNA polymerase sigma-70 factor (ECF subfamily)
VWNTAYRLVGNEADAADCFQKTFISALELSRREPIANWRPLLGRLATIRALDRLRERHRDAPRWGPLPDHGTPDSRARDPLRAAQGRELAEHLRTALAEIDERQAHVFCLACLDELSYDEIASQLGLTVNHVGVLLNRARTTLRERLAAHRPEKISEAFEKESQP